MIALRDLAARWHTEADLLERRGASSHAQALRACASELEQHVTAWELERLTIAQAAEESGYSEAQLRRQFPRQRTIPRRHLPKKPQKTPDGPDLVGRILPLRVR